MTLTHVQLINRFCEISLIVAISIQKTNKLPTDTDLLEEESQIRRLAWDNQISPDELHLAALRYKKANGIDITEAQISDHIAKMRTWKQEKAISDRRQRIEAEMFERIKLGA